MTEPTAKATLRGLLGIALVGLLAVVFGVFTFVEGRDQLCDVVGVVPGVDCGPADDPDPSAVVAAGVLAVGALVLAVVRWRMLRSWRKAAEAGVGRARPAAYWPVGVARDALGVLAVTVFLVVTARIESDEETALRAWPVFVFGAFTLVFALLETGWAWRRTFVRTKQRAGRGKLADVMAAGGGWCAFDATIAGLADGRPPGPAPITGAPCVGWAVGAEVKQVRFYDETINHSPYESVELRQDHTFDTDDGHRIWEEWAGNDRPGLTKISVKDEWYEFHNMACSQDPFTVAAEGAHLVVDPRSVVIVPTEEGRHWLDKRHHGDWYDFVKQVTEVERYGQVMASLGLFRPGDRVRVQGCVHPVDGHWRLGTVEEGNPHLPHPIAPELARELVAAVEGT